MRTVLVCFAIFISNFAANAQLVYLGDDVIQKKYDGYAAARRTTGLVKLGYDHYYITPNGNFYQTDGTENNTKINKQFPPQDIAYLNATNKYVYFTYGGNNDIVKDLVRYSPATGISVVTDANRYNSFFQLNHMQVPGQKSLVDEVFTSYDKTALLIRKYSKDNFYVYIINDANDNAKVNLVYSVPLDMSNVTTPISTNTEVETYKNDVYFNGREKPTGVYETSINIIQPTNDDKTQYDFKNNYLVRKYGLYPYDRLLRTKNNMYSLIKVVDSVTKEKYVTLFSFGDTKITDVPDKLTTAADDVDTQIIDGEIYISYKGNLQKYSEQQKKYIPIINERNADKSWDNIDKNTRFLKAGNYFMYRRNAALYVYNYNDKSTKEIANSTLAKNSNFNTQYDVYAYAGNNSFYFTQLLNNKEVFTRYDPVANTYTPIEFPGYKKQDFDAVKAILHNGNKFVFLTSYLGKKNAPVYKMFMYTEEGAALPNSSTSSTSAYSNTEAKTETKIFELAKFDKKLFADQLIKIINDQTNEFKNIKGESITSEAPKYKSTATLTGFSEGTIIDYKRDSKIIRYEARTATIKGKANAIAYLDMLDAEIQKIIAGKNINRVIDVNVKTRKQIFYLNTDGTKILQLDLYSFNDFTNDDDAVFTITLRADKKAN